MKQEQLYAGVAKSDITTHSETAVVKDPLFAKALVLDDGTTQIVIIAMDATAIGGRDISDGILYDIGSDFLPLLRHRIQNELKIPGCNVLVNASHTHPPGRILCSDAEQSEKTFDAVYRAQKNMLPVKIGTGLGYEDRITMNRTLRLKNGMHWTIRHAYPCPPDKDLDDVGPIDPDIGIIRVDRIDGRPLAVVYNFAGHPLFGDTQGSITANFPGIASKVIEENFGDDVMALFLQGTGGDVSDISVKDFERPRDIEPLGTKLGLSVLKALKAIEVKNEKLSILTEYIELPRRTDIPKRIELLLQEQTQLLESLRSLSLNFKAFLSLYIKYTLHPEYPLDYSYRYLQAEKTGVGEFSRGDAFNRANIEKYLKNICVMEKLVKIREDIATLKKHQSINQRSGERTITAEIQGVKFGDCVLVTSPAELLVEVGMNIKKSSPCKYTFIAAYSNGYLHYGCPASYYDKGGYEVTECLLDPAWQNIFEQKVNAIIRKL